MQIRLKEPAALAALRMHLEASGFAVCPVGAATMVVEPGDGEPAAGLAFQLRLWELAHPGHPVEVLAAGPAAALVAS